MNAVIEVKRTDDGVLLARRLDGRSLTPEDKAEAKRIAASEAALVSDPAMIVDGSVVAVLIDSTVLGSSIWFAFRDGWTPDAGDLTPIFYANELPALSRKTPEQLRDIFNVKHVFGGGVVRQ